MSRFIVMFILFRTFSDPVGSMLVLVPCWWDDVVHWDLTLNYMRFEFNVNKLTNIVWDSDPVQTGSALYLCVSDSSSLSRQVKTSCCNLVVWWQNTSMCRTINQNKQNLRVYCQKCGFMTELLQLLSDTNINKKLYKRSPSSSHSGCFPVTSRWWFKESFLSWLISNWKDNK